MEFEIVRGRESDQDRIFKYLAEHFYPDEPLNLALHGTQTILKENCASLGVLKDDLSLIAVEKDDPDKICAVFLNKEILKETENGNWPKLLKRTSGTPYGKILKFLDDVSTLSNDVMNELWNKYDTDRAVDIFMISVRKDCRRQNLAQRLMRETINLASERKYRWLSIGCTNTYSSQLAKKLGFDVVFELPYNEYKNEEGEVVFRTPPPHDAFRILVKELPA